MENWLDFTLRTISRFAENEIEYPSFGEHVKLKCDFHPHRQTDERVLLLFAESYRLVLPDKSF